MSEHAFIPKTLVAAVKRLRFENPSDRKWAHHALADKAPPTQCTIAWLSSLVRRKGVRFNADNDEHKQPGVWPLP